MVDPIIFKQPLSPHGGWLSYGIAIVIMLVMIVILAKKHKPFSTPRGDCKLIEKKHLGHKTVVYVIEYHQQRFLLADNQQALAIHPLTEGVTDEIP